MDKNLGSEIREYEDRWVLRPMRGSRIIRTIWRPDLVEFETDTPFRIAVGYESEMAPRSVAEHAPERHTISHWPRTEVERNVSAPILSPVFFKSGGMRIGFGNGWKLFVSDRHPEVSATIFFGDTLMWSRSGLASPAEFPVVTLDPWTGQRIEAPPWPSRPPELEIDSGSDDING
ncbi:hypothetical protein ACLMAL_35515 [Nocardia sp. CWNU-33]|uniref:hypothetical protein n=1 Tax=Nocardia sp. CWNU-33 TaxID=3392117 RepID=UPI00398F5755